MFFWIKSPCGLVGRSQRFREARCLHLQGLSDEATLLGSVYIAVSGKSQGKGQSGRVRQKLSRANEDTLSRRQKREEYVTAVAV
jgi:hypothetical protein